MRKFERRSDTSRWPNDGRFAIPISGVVVRGTGASNLTGRYGSQKLFVVYLIQLHSHQSQLSSLYSIIPTHLASVVTAKCNAHCSRKMADRVCFHGDGTDNGHDHRDGKAGDMRTRSSRGGVIAYQTSE